MCINKRSFLAGVFLSLVALWSVAPAGSVGKIRGKVVDNQTKEALIGANIVVMGTSLGASTDAEGEFIILNLEPGTYTVKASYVGYQSVSKSNIVVSINLTTQVDFELPQSSILAQTVEIVAEMPLINKSATNTVAIVTSDVLQRMPVRNVTQVFSLASGVVHSGDDFYVRGGRAEETSFYVDGVLVNNPVNGRMTSNVINNAIEEIQSQIGGMTAEYGNTMSGVVSTTTKIGAPTYNFSVEAITDELGGKTSKNIFGAYSYGLNEYVLTVSGPVIPGYRDVRFFLAGQRQFNRSNPSYIDGIHFPITFDSTKIVGADFYTVNRDSGIMKPLGPGKSGNRSYLANLFNASQYDGGRQFGGYSQDAWAVSGNFFVDLGSLNIKTGGSYNTQSSLGSYGRDLGIISYTAGMPRGVRTEQTDATAYLKFTYILSKKTLITLNLNYYRFTQESGDQFWFSDIESYGDPNKNPVLVGPSQNPPQFSYLSFAEDWPGAIPSRLQ